MGITYSPDFLPKNASAYISAGITYKTQIFDAASGAIAPVAGNGPITRLTNVAGNVQLTLPSMATASGHTFYVEVGGRTSFNKTCVLAASGSTSMQVIPDTGTTSGTANLYTGMLVSGSNITAGTTISAINPSTAVTATRMTPTFGATYSISAISANGSQVTYSTTNTANIIPGQPVSITGATNTAFNGYYTVLSVVNNVSFTVTSTATGTTSSANAVTGRYAVTAISGSGTAVTYSIANTTGLTVGMPITITTASTSAYNGTYNITAININSSIVVASTATGATSTAIATTTAGTLVVTGANTVFPGQIVTVSGANRVYDITGITANGTTVTYALSDTTNLVSGQSITVSGASTAGFNGTFTVGTVTTNVSFTATNSTTGSSSTATGSVATLSNFNALINDTIVAATSTWFTISSVLTDRYASAGTVTTKTYLTLSAATTAAIGAQATFFTANYSFTPTFTWAAQEGTVYWDGGSAPTLTSSLSGTTPSRSIVQFASPNGTDFYGSVLYSNLAV